MVDSNLGFWFKNGPTLLFPKLIFHIYHFNMRCCERSFLHMLIINDGFVHSFHLPIDLMSNCQGSVMASKCLTPLWCLEPTDLEKLSLKKIRVLQF